MNFNINKVKIFVTIPVENVDEVRTAMCEVGAGIIGNYTFCSSSVKTEPSDFDKTTRPSIGLNI